MEEFDKELAQYGIFAKNAQKTIEKERISIFDNTIIKTIDFNILQVRGIKELNVINNEILEIYFAKENNIKIYFANCIFKNEIIAPGLFFNEKVCFINCIFQKNVLFSKSIFENFIKFSNSEFKKDANFYNIIFKAKCDSKFIENDFRAVKFNGNADFAEATFYSKVSFLKSTFNNKADFEKAKFLFETANKHEEISINNFKQIAFNGEVSFLNAEFNSNIEFSLSKFKNDLNFLDVFLNDEEIIFYNIEFHNVQFGYIGLNTKTFKSFNKYIFIDCKFQDNLVFKSLNNKELFFINTVFNSVINFNNIQLIKKPNFENCTFSNQFNIEHKYIEYKFDEIEKMQEYDKLLNYRDLFRKLKSNRIAHHNLIDASELRVQELYARELELKYKENKSLKEKIEQWQLFFYRKLCDHHTDLLLNLKWLVITLGIFASIFLIIKINKYGINILDIFNTYGIYASSLGCFLLFVLAFFKCLEKMKAFVCVNLIIIFWVICYKPKIIFGIANLIGDNNYNIYENLLITIYTIIVGLVLFSLQKTARKNSIVPN